MALKEYGEKREFNKTPEPRGGKSGSSALQFVVQKHDASRLHYDFRLEMGGVLKSWAVPKGPSLNPQDKRLAMKVEDHPFDYKDFEGIIPEGNYGAGRVIVWDQGNYEPLIKEGSKKAQEKELLKELRSGSLKFRLRGKKLKGEFALVHIKNNRQKGDNAWLLIKHKDEYASASDITKKVKSVRSGKTIAQVGKDKKAKEWISGKPKAGKQKIAKPEEPAVSTPLPGEIRKLLEKGKKAAIPAAVKPMLATLVERPFDGKDWIFEIKWDGYRAVAKINKGKAGIESRHNISFDEKFLPVKQALEKWSANAVVDGEIIALTEDGRPDFQELQGFLKQGKAAILVYYLFDLLWYEGKDYTGLPLIERKAILQHILPAGDNILKYSDHVEEKGISFFDAAIAKGLEGVMAKRADSLYTPNLRSKNWLKIKNNQFAEAIICGFTKGRQSRKYFGAVILGRYEKGELKYIGHSGSGFDDLGLKDLFEKFQPLITEKCPFKVRPKTNMPATWLRPELVCLIKYTETTRDGSFRHPVYAGLREDKKAAEEKKIKVLKVPGNTRTRKEGIVNKHPSGKEKIKIERERAASIVKSSRKTDKTIGKAEDLLVQPGEKQKDVTIRKHPLSLSNLTKIYWPGDRISKGDLINYYYRVAEFIMPFLKDRPQSLNRHPNGIEGETFYQKNVGDKVPEWVKTFPYISESDGKKKKFLVATDEASLIYMANLGCIEMNPWNSRIQKPGNPDWCVIDIDPDKTNSFKQVVEVALQIRAYLDHLKVASYCKTSGSTGMHIYIPLGARYSYDQSRMFAELVVSAVQQEMPGLTSIERSLSKRNGKIYLDFLQNRQIQTIAAPYSIRPKPGATVSMPLHWEELKPGLKTRDFTIFNAPDRIRQEPDIFKAVLGPGVNLRKILAETGKE
ncbi:MAG: DNA ligase D [Bacteroidota bacterium]|nr:DNA ligase D [Bacteroidota bacterium]